MTGRERVERALNHEEPDRVPLDVGGTWVSGMTVEAYEKLKRHLGISAPTQYLDARRRLARLDEGVLERLGSDTRPVILRGGLRYGPQSRFATDIPRSADSFVDELGITWKKAPFEGGYYWEQSTWPLAEATIEDLETYPWPDLDDPRRYETLGAEVERLFHETTYALVGDFRYKNFWEPVTWLLGFERALVALITEQEFVTALLDKLYWLSEKACRHFLRLAGPYLTAVRCSDDLGTQQSLLLSPQTYRSTLKPFHARFFALINRHTDAKVLFHTDGNIVALLDDLVEAGVDALNPVQSSAITDLDDLKAQFGSRISFWGSIDTQHVLPHGTPDQVREEVRLRIHQLGSDGGFVAAPVHNIQADVPPENILAMCDAVHELGRYRTSN